MKRGKPQPKSIIAVLGFSDEEREIIQTALTKSTMELYEAEYVTDLLVNDYLMLIVDVSKVSGEELQPLLAYYNQIAAFSESVILVGDCRELDFNNRITVYGQFEELQNKLKYLLLAAQKQRKNADNFSRSLSYALIILKMITDNPGISSKEIADRLEISPRSVTRYIETLNMAGESIVYNRKENGWSLEYDESLLKL